ncbi:MAG: AAA family ATPase [Candidatus Thalassarchaeaceae archaeon]|jgi:cytidylate kinase|nr:AAA family ATPase [Candidatus Thalassarchaeaceae archaeon]MDP6703661.1 AAA family ATPase [Candidatus Thalassarchaeaceae archaeon]MDP7003718.1 AAA family ATPase [Candidatus Thalassarchaeaceae archaeon]
MSGGEILVIITISGPPGSGTSTLVSKLTQAYEWDSLNGGDVFRKEAARRGLSVEDLSAVAKGDLDIDRALDALLQELMSAEESPEIIESRLCGWWAYRMGIDCLRVWVAVSEGERARRIKNREGGDFEDCLKRAKQRQRDDMERYRILYGIDLDDLSPYNLVIEADEKDEDEVFAIVHSNLGK